MPVYSTEINDMKEGATFYISRDLGIEKVNLDELSDEILTLLLDIKRKNKHIKNNKKAKERMKRRLSDEYLEKGEEWVTNDEIHLNNENKKTSNK